MSENYVTICGQVADALRPEHGGKKRDRVQFLGGITTLALGGEKTTVNPDDQTIEAAEELFLPTTRDNGSRRDIDLLVKTTDSETIHQVLDSVKKVVDGRLDVSVFGLAAAAALGQQIARPLGFSAIKTFLSTRYYDDENKQLYRALFPFQVPLDEQTIRTWNLVVGGQEIPVPDPSATLLNYAQRSISGLRPKDRPKWQQAFNNLERIYPDAIEQIQDGVFRGQAELTILIDSLRDHPDSASRLLGFNHLSKEELLSHEAFMVKDAGPRLARFVLNIARFKAGGLSFFENSKLVTGLWQQYAEPLAAGLIGNAKSTS
jgi:hypothetical protein